jgi:hypothetical protein
MTVLAQVNNLLTRCFRVWRKKGTENMDIKSNIP